MSGLESDYRHGHNHTLSEVDSIVDKLQRQIDDLRRELDELKQEVGGIDAPRSYP